ncbi:MAG: DinB family protein [Gemmatimonadota bacterium]|nr:DinB family protein [Gemmatimonadota bacterium]
MPDIHDSATREAIKRRIGTLRPDSERRWGRMTPDQMLWHCAEGIDAALGRVPYKAMMKPPPLPKSWIRALLIGMPWPKGKLQTAPQFVATERHDFDAQRSRLLAGLDQLAATDPRQAAQVHPIFGANTIGYQSRLAVKHLNHHLTQFGA